MNMSEIALIFDGDDTLWQAQGHYNQSKRKFFSIMEKLGFDSWGT